MPHNASRLVRRPTGRLNYRIPARTRALGPLLGLALGLSAGMVTFDPASARTTLAAVPSPPGQPGASAAHSSTWATPSYRRADLALLSRIAGPTTGFTTPREVGIDGSGNVYVSHLVDANTGEHAISVFGKNAAGDVAPSRLLRGPDTGLLHGARGVSVLPNGDIVTCNFLGNTTPGRILVFDKDATGNTPAKRSIDGVNTNLSQSNACTTDANGRIYVASRGRVDGVLVFSPGAQGDTPPERAIYGGLTGFSDPIDIAVDSAGFVYVADYAKGDVRVFAPTASGGTPPSRIIKGSFSRPISVAVDSVGNVYVGDSPKDGMTSGALHVFAPGENKSPVTVLQPAFRTPGTALSDVAVTSENELWLLGTTYRFSGPQGVAFTGGPDLLRYGVPAATPTTTAPPLGPLSVTRLRVTGNPRSRTRAITWKAPLGTAKLTYGVTITVGKKRLYRTHTTKTHVTLNSEKLLRRVRGKLLAKALRVTVVPSTSRGAGPARSAKFRIRPR